MGKVRVAFLGCGGFMGAHAGRLKPNPEVEIVGLCDVSPDAVEAFRLKHLADYLPQPSAHTDAAAMFAGLAPDAVFVATPHTLHFAHGVQALDAGCHVYMEKPMVTSSEQAYRLRDKVRESGRILVAGYNTPCSPEFTYLRDCIRNETFGKLEMVNGYLSQGWMKGTAGKWRQDPALSGGGQAYDSGAHILNSLVWSVESPVDTVFAFVDNHGAPVDINSTIAVRFSSGVAASLCVNGNCPGWGTHMVFLFDGGRVEIDGWTGSWINVFDGKGERVKYPPITGKQQTPTDNFIDAILGRAEPRTSVQNGIVHSELMDAIYESARTGLPASPRARAQPEPEDDSGKRRRRAA